MIKKWFKNIGPGPLIAAAFIGPGTITVCTLAGVYFGFALLWAMVLSIVATIVLQEMSARVGIVSQKGLSKIIRTEIKNPIVKWLTIVLILSAIVIGNAVYEAGNISGGILGLETILGDSYINIGSFSLNYLSILIGIIAFVLLFIGNYKVLEKALISLVIAMSLAFLITAIITKPDLLAIFSSIFKPSLPKDGLLTVIALIGTTVVPYNLFLHAAAARKKWTSETGTRAARTDSALSIGLGGLVSILILSTAASSLFKSGLDVTSAADMARAIEPTFGEASRFLIGIGLFAAGLTSAITAPMATAYALSEIIGGNEARKSKLFRGIALFVVLAGAAIRLSGIRPVSLILIAQYANGLLLPLVAAFLLYVMNRKDLLGAHANGLAPNVAGSMVVLITFGLGLRSILRAAGVM